MARCWLRRVLSRLAELMDGIGVWLLGCGVVRKGEREAGMGQGGKSGNVWFGAFKLRCAIAPQGAAAIQEAHIRHMSCVQ